jgi:hypothetical protein
MVAVAEQVVQGTLPISRVTQSSPSEADVIIGDPTGKVEPFEPRRQAHTQTQLLEKAMVDQMDRAIPVSMVDGAL